MKINSGPGDFVVGTIVGRVVGCGVVTGIVVAGTVPDGVVVGTVAGGVVLTTIDVVGVTDEVMNGFVPWIRTFPV
jgi:hypothetical protein